VVTTQKDNKEYFRRRFHSHLFSRTEEKEKKTECRTCGCTLLSAMFSEEAVITRNVAFWNLLDTNTTRSDNAILMET